MQYMGDYPMDANMSEIDCVITVLRVSNHLL